MKSPNRQWTGFSFTHYRPAAQFKSGNGHCRKFHYEWLPQESAKRRSEATKYQCTASICNTSFGADRTTRYRCPPVDKAAGFTDEERGKFTELLQAGFVDTFRTLYPEQTGIYTWWSHLRKARDTNAGWRIDYFVASERLKQQIAAKNHS